MRTFLRLTIFSLFILLMLGAFFSLKWKMGHDTPLFFYMAHAIDKWNLVPYADFFDVNPPGTHVFYYLFCKVFGYSDLGFRIGDLVCLALLLTLTYLLMSEFGIFTACISAILFGLVYFRGTGFTLQRDYLTLLPITLAIVALFRLNPSGLFCGYFIGLLLGLSSTIKPNILIGTPSFFVYQLIESHRVGSIERVSFRGLALFCLCYGLGLATPWLVALVSLWYTSALDEFLGIVTNYWPLYRNISGEGNILVGIARVLYLIKKTYTLGGLSLILVPAVLGVFVGLFRSNLDLMQRRKVWFLFSLMCVYAIYPALGGKFWPYHWSLFAYFSLILASLCALEQTGEHKRKAGRFTVAVMLVCLLPFCVSPTIIMGGIKGEGLPYITLNNVEEITRFLRSRLTPEDTVQPLDWTGGTLHAMLRADAKPGTSFLYDEQFYHHTKSDYVKFLRNRFIKELSQNKPRFVIEVLTSWPRHSGIASDAQFPELRSMLRTHYTVVILAKDYLIYERK